MGLIKARKNAPESEPSSDAGAEKAAAPKPKFVATDANVETAPRHRGVRIGDLLRERDLVTDEQIELAVAEQKESGKRLGIVLVEMGLIAERDLAIVLADQLGLDVVDLRHASLDGEVVSLLPEQVARDLHAIPMGRKGPHLEIAVGDPLMPDLLNRLIQATESPVRMVVAGVSDIELAIDRSYKSTAKVDDAIRVFEMRAEALKANIEQPIANSATVDEHAPVVQVVNLILEQAVRDRASDVHIEPQADIVRVRVRTDGALH